jgi:hypothetical protein
LKHPRRTRTGCLLLCLTLCLAESRSAELVEELERHVGTLAAEKLEGRLAGSAGERQAAEYIARELKQAGALPLAGHDSLLLPFSFAAGTDDAGSRLELLDAAGERLATWKGAQHVRALSFSDSATLTGPVVFAGYGISLPPGQSTSYDSFAGLDVRDKIVLVLRYSPEEAPEELRLALIRYSGLRYKAMRARELGARALLVVSGPTSPGAGETIPPSFDAALSGSGIAAASISGAVAERMMRQAGGRSLEEAQRALDTGNPHVTGFELPGVTLSLAVKVKRERRTAYNVVGRLSPADGAQGSEPERTILVGAHLDHLGRGLLGNSLARKGEAGQVHRGADDNASGVAAVLAAAARLAELPRRSTLLFAFWSGEELGLLGSGQFIKDAVVPRERMAAYVNLDMVGRMRENRLTLQGTGSSGVWPRLIEQVNVVVGFDVRTSTDPYLPTDSSTFYQAGIPVLNLFTGTHEDYHRPTDVPQLVNYPDLVRVVDFTVLMVRKLDALQEPIDYLEVERQVAPSADRDGLRAYTGTIPDYGAEVQGLRLSGVIAGGPADRAGLREGDVIIEFGGRTITNIYDYTYALEAAKIDEPVRVVFQRDGARHEVTVTPTRR